MRGEAHQPVRGGQRRAALVSLSRDRLAMAAVLVLLLVICASFVPPQWMPGDPFSSDLRSRLKPPVWLEGGSWTQPLGTDNLGRDVLTRVMLGARTSLLITLFAVSISSVLGIGLGVLAGYAGGWIDTVVMRLVDMQLAFPLILMIIAVVAVIGPSLPIIVLVLGLSGWGQFAKLVRAETLRVKSAEFVEASRALGNRAGAMVVRHVLPNVASTVIVLITFEAARMLLLESAVSFLGLGVQPPAPSWGLMISDGRNYVYQGWWIATAPGLAVCATVLALNLLGDGLRDALDPRKA